ncbi:MAG: AAA family ATPase [Alphaproteobacteria bacterium]|nr:AAA family ATPase [Alphaproteobacteria bacterium]
MISINALEAFYQTPTILDLNNISTPVSHDRVASTRNIQNDNKWHNNMIRNVGSYVAKGLSDEEIQTIASSYTRPGYTTEETKREAQKAIDGARAKGFSPLIDTRKAEFSKEPGSLFKPLLGGIISPTKYLVQGLIPEDSIVTLFGAPASGKSFIALYLACSVASGVEFFGKNVDSGPVFYIAGEGKKGLEKRGLAWNLKYNIYEYPVLVALSQTSVSLLDAAELVFLRDEIDLNGSSFGRPKLIIIDTLNRNFGNGDENSNADMAQFIKSLEFLQKTYGCSILIVHHSGHADKGRVRGASALTAAVDAEYCVKLQQDGIIEFSCTKMKDEEPPKKSYFKLEPLPDDLTPDNFDETLAVLEVVERNKSDLKVIPKKYVIGVDALKEAELIHGEQMNKYGPKSVPEHKWREVYFKRSPADNYEAKRKAFSRVKNGLVADDFIEVNDNYFTRKEK